MHTADFWTIRDGKIIAMVEYYDTALAASVL
jgi:ketosteroid isomerase-like protein